MRFGIGKQRGSRNELHRCRGIDFADLFALVAELELILAANGHAVEFGSGVAAVQRVYAEKALPKLEFAATGDSKS